MPVPRPASCHPWGISIKLLGALHGGGAEISTSFHLPHLNWESHTHMLIQCTVTGLAVGLNPHGSGGLPAALCRTPQIIPVLADSHRMLILSHLFYCTGKSGSSSQSLFLLSSPLSLSVTLHPLPQSSKISPKFPAPSSFYHLLFNPILSSP